jgi:hypothetical protein
MSIARRARRLIRVVDGLIEYDGPPSATATES